MAPAMGCSSDSTTAIDASDVKASMRSEVE